MDIIVKSYSTLKQHRHAQVKKVEHFENVKSITMVSKNRWIEITLQTGEIRGYKLAQTVVIIGGLY